MRSSLYEMPSANSAFRVPCSALEVVAREGSAPPTSGCRPDVILFHYRGRVEARLAKAGCRGWNCTSIRAFKGRCPTIRRPGKNWWPAGVTRPVLRIKSPLHHFNACRPKWACRVEAQQAKTGARGWNCTNTGDVLNVVSLLLDYASKRIGSSSR